MKRKPIMKDKSQSKNYASSVRGIHGYHNTTESVGFENLQGSNDGLADYENNSKPRGEKKRRAKKFFRKHLFEILVTAVVSIVIGIMSWVSSSLISLKQSIAVYNYRLDQMQTSLGAMENNTIDKEYLSQEIKLLKLELQSASARDLASLELRIALLEEQIKDK